MRILSWDIGIRNLSWCEMELCDDGHYIVYDWNVINFMDPEERKRYVYCDGTLKTGLPCRKGASVFIDSGNYCGIHDPGKVPKGSRKKKVPKGNAKGTGKKGKKKGHRYKHMPLQELSRRLTMAFDKLNILNGHIDVVLIESQPKFALATVRHVMDFLLCYLTIRAIDKGLKTKIITISAKRKLSVYDGPFIRCNVKDPYQRNKKLGIEYCRYMLDEKLCNDELEPEAIHLHEPWATYFESFKKKDDLADSFLQGAWYLMNDASKASKANK